MPSAQSDRAADDELGIFIDAEGNFRILVPNGWTDAIPEFAYLSVGAVLRLSHPAEKEFARSIASWADANLRRKNGEDVEFVPAKKPRPN